MAASMLRAEVLAHQAQIRLDYHSQYSRGLWGFGRKRCWSCDALWHEAGCPGRLAAMADFLAHASETVVVAAVAAKLITAPEADRASCRSKKSAAPEPETAPNSPPPYRGQATVVEPGAQPTNPIERELVRSMTAEEPYSTAGRAPLEVSLWSAR